MNKEELNTAAVGIGNVVQQVGRSSCHITKVDSAFSISPERECRKSWRLSVRPDKVKAEVIGNIGVQPNYPASKQTKAKRKVCSATNTGLSVKRLKSSEEIPANTLGGVMAVYESLLAMLSPNTDLVKPAAEEKDNSKGVMNVYNELLALLSPAKSETGNNVADQKTNTCVAVTEHMLIPDGMSEQSVISEIFSDIIQNEKITEVNGTLDHPGLMNIEETQELYESLCDLVKTLKSAKDISGEFGRKLFKFMTVRETCIFFLEVSQKMPRSKSQYKVDTIIRQFIDDTTGRKLDRWKKVGKRIEKIVMLMGEVVLQQPVKWYKLEKCTNDDVYILLEHIKRFLCSKNIVSMDTILKRNVFLPSSEDIQFLKSDMMLTAFVVDYVALAWLSQSQTPITYISSVQSRFISNQDTINIQSCVFKGCYGPSFRDCDQLIVLVRPSGVPHFYTIILEGVGSYITSGLTLKVFVLDSVARDNSREVNEFLLSFKRLCHCLMDEEVRAVLLEDSSILVVRPDCPRQENGVDCGLFTLMNIRKYLDKREKPTDQNFRNAYTQEDVKEFRKSLAEQFDRKELTIAFNL